MKRIIAAFAGSFFFVATYAQDTTVIIDNQKITLPEVVVHNNMDYLAILKRIQNDTTFYKAFRSLHLVEFKSYNDIRILNKDGSPKATWSSVTEQKRDSGCRTTNVISQQTTGDFFDKKGEYNYTTGEMYASIFLSKGKVCGETNIVSGRSFTTSNKSGMEKHKEQLKMLFFNPGKKIPGIPFIGDKLDLYDDRAHKLYDYKLEFIDYKDSYAYVFSIKPKEDLGLFHKDDIVVDEMTTWFDYKTLEVLARNYSLSYKAGVYDFDVSMKVEMTRIRGILVPQIMHYKGNFGVLLKKGNGASLRLRCLILNRFGTSGSCLKFYNAYIPLFSTFSLTFAAQIYFLNKKIRVMNNYELMVIFTPVLSEEEFKAAQKKYTDYVTELGGSVTHSNPWGLKSLAYPVQKKTTGIYWVLEYSASSSFNEKLKVQMLRDEHVMRQMVTVLDKYAVEYNAKKRSGVPTGTEKAVVA